MIAALWPFAQACCTNADKHEHDDNNLPIDCTFGAFWQQLAMRTAARVRALLSINGHGGAIFAPWQTVQPPWTPHQ
jgi:hypothetical protein